jgi:ketosteroid isomerase-like protein
MSTTSLTTATNKAALANKDIARRFLLAIPARDAVAMRSLLAPEAHLSLVIAGVYSPHLRAFPQGTQWDRDGTIAMEMDLQHRLEGPFELRILSLIAEGDSVAAEVIGKGSRAATGRAYINHYSYHFQMDNGRIADIRLYQDTFHHWQVWSDLGSDMRPHHLHGGKLPGAATGQTVEPLSDSAAEDRVAVNKTSVRRFVAAVRDRDWDAIRALWSPDGMWCPAVGGDYSPEQRAFDGARRWDREGMIELLQNAGRNHREPLTLDLYTLIAEEDQVSAEAVGFTLRVNGRAYRQHYSLHFKARNGKLVECHEYQDTLHQYDVTLDAADGGPVVARTSPVSP